MKINIVKNLMASGLCFLAASSLPFISCNKTLPDATPIIYPPVNNSTTSIGDLLNSDTSFSFYKAAATKVGMIAQFSDLTKVFTAFIPNNDAFRASGIPSINVVNALPPATLGGIVGYSIIPGQQYLSTSVPATFPNTQLPTSITIGTLPGTTINFNLTTFPSVSTSGFYDNNIPVVKPDLKMSNGVVHVVAAIVAPPSELLKDAIYNDPNLTFFKAAIARADSGQTGLNKLDSLLGYAATNMTVLAPNNNAFGQILFKLIYSSLLQQGVPSSQAGAMAISLSGSPNVFSNPLLFSSLTAATVRGIVGYHFLATDQGAGFQPNIRVFSNNFLSTPSFYTTLVNSVYPTHPGIMAQATFTGPFVTKLQFTGLGTFPPGGTPFSGTPANAITLDNQAVNGVYYVIDQVLLPQ